MLKYLALGDSYTIGEAVSEQDRWPVQLAKRLRQEDIPVQDPHIIAATGWTSGKLQSAIDKENLQSEWDLVSLLIGVNNQYRKHDLDVFRQEFTSLLQKAIFFARKKPEGVFVLSIPDYGVTPFSAGKDAAEVAREIDQYNTLSEDICKRFGIAYHNITGISKKAATDPALLAEDELHPSGVMYAQWVELIYKDVVNQIRLLRKV
jgi:lysophospholipase L1-like esterase